MMNFNNMTAKEKAEKTAKDLIKRKAKRERDKYYSFRKYIVESVERAKK